MEQFLEQDKDFRGICYTNNFLDRVIFRFDFLKPILTEKIFSEEIVDKIQKKYPIKGKQQKYYVSEVEVKVNQKSEEGQYGAELTRNDQFLKQAFANNDGNRVILSNTYILFEVRNYSSYNDIRSDINMVLDSVFQEESSCSMGRIGVRYINIFDSGKIVLRKKFFSDNVASLFIPKSLLKKGNFDLTRSLRREEYRYMSMTLNFVYGMYNTEYPRKLEKKDFVMDYDCFKQEVLTDKTIIMKNIDNAHYAVQYLFEESITDMLREVMQNE